MGPVAMGVLALFSRRGMRLAAVLVTVGVLAYLTAVSYHQIPFTYAPPEIIAGLSWHTIIAVTDFALLAYFLYIGIILRSPGTVVLAVLQVVALSYVEMSLENTETPAFAMDSLSFLFTLLVAFVGSLIVIYAVPYLDRYNSLPGETKVRPQTFFFYLLAFLGVMNGLVLSDNLLWVFFFWETTTLFSFLLINSTRTALAGKNALRALWMNLLGGLAFAMALVFCAVAGVPLSLRALLVAESIPLFPLALLILAAFTKAAQMPFQSWLVGAMVAPTPVSALLHSSTMVKAAVYLVIRLAPMVSGTTVGLLTAVAASFTFAITAGLAISQPNAKKVLAYSTIGNMGMIISAAAMGTPLAIAAALVLTVFHAVSKALLFLAVGNIELGIGTKNIEEMEGLLRKMPLTCLITVFGMVSMLLPPFGVLVGKWLAIEAVAREPVVLLLVIFGSAFSVVFWAKWIGRLTSITYRSGTWRESMPVLAAITLVGLLATTILASVGLAPLFKNLLAPFVRALFGSPGLYAPDGQVLSHIGRFAPWGIFLLLLGLFMVTRLFSLTFRRVRTVPPYLCGENSAQEPQLHFYAQRDESTKVVVGNYYLERAFGEEFLTFRANPVAIALLLLLIGVTIR